MISSNAPCAEKLFNAFEPRKQVEQYDESRSPSGSFDPLINRRPRNHARRSATNDVRTTKISQCHFYH
jgi:hypothetical protein